MVSGISFLHQRRPDVTRGEAVAGDLEVANSSATVLVRPAMPCLAENIADLNGEATSECAEAVLIMRPQPRFFMLANDGECHETPTTG